MTDKEFEFYVAGFDEMDQWFIGGGSLLRVLDKAALRAREFGPGAMSYMRGAQHRWLVALGMADGLDAKSKRPKVKADDLRWYLEGYQAGIKARRRDIATVGPLGEYIRPYSREWRPSYLDIRSEMEPPGGNRADSATKARGLGRKNEGAE